jgi:hypothetical protein
MKRILIAATLVLASAASAELYKYVDKDGRTVYADQPPTGISSKQINPAVGSAPGGKSAVERDKELEKGRKEAREKSEKGDKAAANKTEMDARCAAARNNVQIYAEGGRIGKLNDKGEREYMGDDEIAAAKEKAQRDVEEACKKT